LFGLSAVVVKDTLGVRNGYINVVSTPYTEKETIRVEMQPGQGEVIAFEAGSDGKIVALNYSGLRFTRVR
jgi:hypothetical protein